LLNESLEIRRVVSEHPPLGIVGALPTIRAIP